MRIRKSTSTIAVAVGLLVIAASSALALTPKPGRHYEVTDEGLSAIVIQMYVDDGTVTSVLANDLDCKTADGDIQGFALDKPFDVSKTGKFKFDGKANNTIYGSGPRKLHVVLKGKFVSSKKATGTYSIEGCPGKVGFETQWEATKG
jgi:hypothetical protein